MEHWINYHHLKYFREIALAGGVSAASSRLRLGQSTLSAQLKTFESQLGVELFERRNKRLHLTEPGRVALNYANEIFRLGQEMLEVLQDVKNPARIPVQIGALDSVPKHVLLEIAKEARRSFDCTLSIREGSEEELLKDLRRHRIDLMVSSAHPRQEGGRFYSRVIARMPVVVCGAPAFKGLRRGFPRSLEKSAFILPSSPEKLRGEIDRWFRQQSLNPNVIAETQDTAVQKLLGHEGLGLLVVPLAAVQAQLNDKSLVEVGRLEGISEEIYLISASRRIENPVSAALMKEFQLI
ncbi:MAG: LysR family transcriptional regulator [Bdellovibrionaceae bacterium]|nr:LysR family transcriptional regulator [Pseudobdellovibrionaceae bacterium]MBX3034597.1 LysR family transcriptional regulator [Pseudobdellovibrionaceae bacterium]